MSLTLIWIASLLAVSSGAEYAADVSMLGLAGRVTFTTSGQSVLLSVQWTKYVFGNPRFNWEIRHFPMDYATLSKCEDAIVGSQVFFDLTAEVGTVANAVANHNVTGLAGKGLIGRSLVLYQAAAPNIRHCANILPVGEMSVAEARLMGESAGRVRIIQGTGATDAMVISDLYWTTGSTSAINAEWRIYSSAVDDSDVRTSRCTALGSQLFDFSASIGNLPVGGVPGTGRMSAVSSQVSLSAVVNRSLVLFDNGNVIGCATIRLYKRKEVKVTFNMDGVVGDIIMSQPNPMQQTMVQMSLHNLRANASGLHVHMWPVPLRRQRSDFSCWSGGVSGHFNPFFINTALPAGQGTDDQYEVGDLSGKYGTLDGLQQLVGNYSDWNLPLFGVYSVVGRSVVMHHPGGARWVCAGIGYPGPVITAHAIFRYPVMGRIMLRQEMDMPWADTSVFSELAYVDGRSPTTGHNIHTHVNGNGVDFNGACTDNGGHFNPFNVSVAPPYKTQCTARHPERCELGDVSGRMGGLDIGHASNSWGRGFWTEEGVPLSSALSAVGRSLVIHAAGGGAPRLACANVYRQYPVRVVANAWSNSATSGSIHISQRSEYDAAEVKLDLMYPNGEVAKYHIHLFPLPDGNEANPCQNKFTGGHYNPLDIDVRTSPPAGTGTHDQYEIGDLSGKFGLLSGTAVMEEHSDYNLHLFGSTSAAGRSIVIHKPDGSRYSCADLDWDVSDGGEVLQAVARFTNNIQGHVMFRQIKRRDGTLGDTTVNINLYYPNGTSTRGHHWHVHQQRLTPGDCSSALGHYNPFIVPINGNYTTECRPNRRLRCEVGDLSGKFGTYDIGGGRRFYTDVDFNLEGNFSIVGRSVVVHRSGGTRLDCADIQVYTSASQAPPGVGETTGASTESLSMLALLLLAVVNLL